MKINKGHTNGPRHIKRRVLGLRHSSWSLSLAPIISFPGIPCLGPRLYVSIAPSLYLHCWWSTRSPKNNR